MSAGNAAANNDGACGFHRGDPRRRTLDRQETSALKCALITVDPLSPSAQTQRMSRDTVNTICAALPGAELSDPFGGGHDAWKVGGKMFACIGSQNTGVSVKTDSIETAQMLIDAGVGVKAPYFHRSWIHLPLESDPEELRHRILVSYDIVRSGLTKKLQASLPARSS